MSYPTDIAGIKLIEHKKSEFTVQTSPEPTSLLFTWSTYALTPEFTQDSAEFLFSSLPSEQEIRFWDMSVNLNVSDPGEMITIQHRNRTLHFMASNHGWSSAWEATNFREIAKHFCRATKVPHPESPEVSFSIHPKSTKSHSE